MYKKLSFRQLIFHLDNHLIAIIANNEHWYKN